MKRLLRPVRPLPLAAVIAVIVFLCTLARWWHPIYGFTAFLQFDEAHETTGIAAFREYPVFPYRGYAPYDGLQYSQMAYHPLLEAVELRTAVDSLAYRARRILLPAAAWLLSAGQPAWIAQVYAGLNIACWLLLAAVFWKKLPVTDTRGAIAWIGLLFSAGVMGSVRLALIDLPALLLVALSLWDAERQRNSRSAGWLAAASLTRETSILAAVAFFDWPPKTRASLLRGLLWTLLAAAPLVLWLAYVRWRLGNVEAGSGNFTWPLVALLGKWRHCLGAMGDPANQPGAWRTLLSTAGLTCQAAFILTWRRPADPWWRLGAVFSALLVCLGPAVWDGDPGAATRVLLPLNLACNVLAVRTRAPLGWLLACNLTIFYGLYVFSSPLPYRDLAAARHGQAAVIVEPGAGWFDNEHNAHHRWVWTESHGRLDIHTWPRPASVEVRLTLKLRGMTPRIIRALVDGREIWRGPIGTNLTTVNLPPLVVTGGYLALDLTTDAPPVLENSRPSARRLGFMVFDPTVVLSEKPSPVPCPGS
jgi:hypothetical protein